MEWIAFFFFPSLQPCLRNDSIIRFQMSSMSHRHPHNQIGFQMSRSRALSMKNQNIVRLQFGMVLSPENTGLNDVYTSLFKQ